MRALTLRPWWAHGIAHLNKRVENRSRAIPKALVGQRVAIHAGACSNGSEMERGLASLKEYAPSLQTSMLHWPYEAPMAWLPPRSPWLHPVARRAIVATAKLCWCRESAPNYRHPWADPDAAWWWRLDDVRTLAEPIPWERGQLGLWNLPDEFVALHGLEVTSG